MPTQLRRLIIDRVDLVDKGANPDADIVLVKRDNENKTSTNRDSPDNTKRGDSVSESWLRKTLTAIAKHVGLDVAKMGMYDDDGKPVPMTMRQMMEHKTAMDDYYKARGAFMESINSIMGMDDAAKQADMLRKTTEEFAMAMKAVMPQMQMMEKSGSATMADHMEALLEDIDAADSAESVFELVKAFDPEGRDKTGAVPPTIHKHDKTKRSDASMDLDTILKGLPEDQRKMLTDALAKSAAPKPDEAVTKRLDELSAQVQTFAKAAEDAKTQLSKAEAQNAELAKSLEAEKDIRVKAEFRKRAEDLRPLGLTVDEAAEALRKAETAGMADMLVKSWQASKKALDESKLFDRMGHVGKGDSDGTDAWSQIEKQATELVSKSGASMSKEQAVAKFLDTDAGKELYNQYISEKGGH